MASERTKIVAVIVVAVALIVLAILGVATSWLGPAGVYALLGLGAARLAAKWRRKT